MAAPRRPRKSAIPYRTAALAVSYARFSDEKQGSIAEQDGINDEIAVDESVTIVERFADAAVSRSQADRPGLSGLWTYLEAHPEVGFLIVNELERLTAGIGQRSRVIEVCQRLRVTIITEDMGRIDPFDEEMMHQADQSALTASAEVLKVRRRTRRNLRQKVINGTVAMRPAFGTRMRPVVDAGGQPLPTGVRLVDERGRRVTSGVLEVDENELPWLRKIFEWANEGISSDEIARRLTKGGVPTKSGKAMWRASSVRGILANPLYKGEMIWGLQATVRDTTTGKKRLEVRSLDDPNVVMKPSPLGALVEPAMWERIAALREARAAAWEPALNARRAKDPHIFDGLVFCGRCGHKMYGRHDATKRKDGTKPADSFRYFCYGYRPGWEDKTLEGFGPVCTKAHTIMEKRIVDALERSTTAGTRAVSVRVSWAAKHDDVGERRALDKERHALDAEAERAVSLALKGLITEERLAAEQADHAARRTLLTERLMSLDVPHKQQDGDVSSDVLARLADLAPLLRDQRLTVAQRVGLIQEAGIRRLYIDGPNVRVELRS